MTICCFTRSGAQCCCQPQDGVPCPDITPEGLRELADILVRGSHHQQADWQRIAQNRAAKVLRYFALGVKVVPEGYEKMRGGKPVAHWRDNALEAAAQIAEAYHSHPGVAADIRAMKSTSGVDVHGEGKP